VLVVGWRAAETQFLRLLRENGLRDALGVLVVGGNGEDVDETVQRMKGAGISGEYDRYDAGFTDLIVKRDLRSFLELEVAS
jgi:hypothetical protein